MARTASNMLALGTAAPDFNLPDTEGNEVRLQDLRGEKGLLLMFICNHCPFVKHVSSELARIGKEYPAKGIGVAAIMSNDVDNYPADSPEKMAEEKQSQGYPFPYLYDATQHVARSYQAACTPDFFLFDGSLRLAYRGQLDDSRPDSGRPVTGADLRAAMDALVNGDPVPEDQKPSLGCNIKWKPQYG